MNRVYSIVYRIVFNQEDAEDITQEIFLKVYNNVKKFEQHASFSTWLYRVATNSALDALDKRKRRTEHSSRAKGRASEDQTEGMDQMDLHAHPATGPEENTLQMEQRECINHVLKKLDREQAQVLMMRDLDDLSYDESAGMLNVGLSAIKMRIHRARLAFQQLFLQLCGKA